MTQFQDRNWQYWRTPEILDIDGVATAVRREGAGETVLYLHDLHDTRQWTPFHAALAEHCDVVAPEHPGFGDSARRKDQDTFEDFVLHYEALVRELELGRVHLVGTGLGAWIAVNLAIHHPDRFHSLTLITPFGLRLEEPFIDVFRMTPDAMARALVNDRHETFASEFAQDGGIDDLVQTYGEDSVAALLYWNPRYDYKLDTRLQRITVPTLVIDVEEDRVVGPHQASGYAARIRDARLETVRGAPGEPSSHGVIFEQPRDVVDAIAPHIVAAK